MTKIDDERTRREDLYESLKVTIGSDNVAARDIRSLGIYTGGRGVYYNLDVTGPVLGTGDGIAVSVLHTGTSCDDDLSESQILYHYPDTESPGKDRAEIQSLKNAYTRTPSIRAGQRLQVKHSEECAAGDHHRCERHAWHREH